MLYNFKLSKGKIPKIIALCYSTYSIIFVLLSTTLLIILKYSMGFFFLSSKIILNFFYFDIIDSDLQMFNIYNESHMSKCFHFI